MFAFLGGGGAIWPHQTLLFPLLLLTAVGTSFLFKAFLNHFPFLVLLQMQREKTIFSENAVRCETVFAVGTRFGGLREHYTGTRSWGAIALAEV